MKGNVFKHILNKAKSLNTPDLHPEYGKYHHFTFIVRNNTVIGYGTNLQDCSYAPKPKYLGYTHAFRSKVHSEMSAYFKNKYHIGAEGFDIINVRLNKQNQLRLSQPCECCINFLSKVNVRNIYFSTKSGFIKLC